MSAVSSQPRVRMRSEIYSTPETFFVQHNHVSIRSISSLIFRKCYPPQLALQSRDSVCRTWRWEPLLNSIVYELFVATSTAAELHCRYRQSPSLFETWTRLQFWLTFSPPVKLLAAPSKTTHFANVSFVPPAPGVACCERHKLEFMTSKHAYSVFGHRSSSTAVGRAVTAPMRASTQNRKYIVADERGRLA